MENRQEGLLDHDVLISDVPEAFSEDEEKRIKAEVEKYSYSRP